MAGMVCNFYSKVKKTFINQKLVNKVISLSVKELKIKPKFSLSVLLIDDQEIRKLNKNFRHKNKVTDVLSFRFKEGQEIVSPKNEEEYLGEIFIAYNQVVKQAKKYNQTVKEEFSLLLIHGFLHLLGYDDKTARQYAKMEKWQDKIMNKLND